MSEGIEAGRSFVGPSEISKDILALKILEELLTECHLGNVGGQDLKARLSTELRLALVWRLMAC
jgi:hypothetical protein